jgi:Fe-S oxidoreductase
MPERVDFWGIPESWGPIVVYTLVGLSFAIMLFRFYLGATLWWRTGRPEARWDKPFTRIMRLFEFAIVQTKVLRQTYPGVMHAALAWSFFVFFLGTALATINGHFFKFLEGPTYLVYKFVLDMFTILFLGGAVLAGYRRFVLKPKRLTLNQGFTISLVFLTFIVINGLLIESLRLAIQRPEWAMWMPAGWAVAQLWIATNASEATLHAWHIGAYTTHFLTVAVFFVTLPVGSLLHILTSPVNIFFSKLEPKMGKLAPIPVNANGEQIFADRLSHLTWKQLLEADACTECGRCQDACPAYAANEWLSPKLLIRSVHDTLHKNGGSRVNGGEAAALIGDVIPDKMLWSCTTCGSCIQECPVLIEHIDLIVDMRRHLVNEGRVDDLLQGALANLGRYGNSFGQSERMRTKWKQSLPSSVPIKDARKEPVEYLWFLGDYAAYNPALADITRRTAEVFQAAGIDYGMLYEAERNAGNDVRRVGEEGLFEILVEKNMAAFAKSEFKTIVTTDPHTYNTLKNEYPPEALQNKMVLHYTELLDQLITSGALKFTKRLNETITYHDPCYLGRYNGIYQAPRRVIQATGCTVIEMPRNHGNALCCGAGGGRIWMDEGEMKERPSENRVREAANLGISTLVVSCPKDVIMFRDAIKTTSLENRLVVKDLIDLVYEAL